MSLELVMEPLKIKQIAGQNTTQTVIENDIIVPDVKPDISRVLLLDGEVYINSAEVLQDRVLIDGAIGYKILYVPDDPEQAVKSINSKAGFTYSLDVPDARQGMQSTVKCEIEHTDFNILNGRKVNVKSVLKISGRVESELLREVARDLEGMDNIQVLSSSFGVSGYLGRGEASAAVRESVEIPAGKPTIREILRNDIKITGKDYKVTDDKIIVKGDLSISTLYNADDENGSIQFMEHEIPFTQFVELPGVDEQCECDIKFRIAESSFEAEEDGDGELRFLKCDVAMDITAEGFARRDVEYIEDAYSPNARVSLDKETVLLQERMPENKSQAVMKDRLTVGDDCPDIVEVFSVLSRSSVTDYKVQDDRIVIEGIVNNRILYLSGDSEQPVFSFEQELPLSHTAEIKGVREDMECDIELDIEHSNYSVLSAKEVEVRLVVGVTSRASSKVEASLITKASEAPLDGSRFASQPSITIYFSQPGDTLWKIAKRYYTTIADIQKLNNISDQDLSISGQQVVIPKRAG